MKAQIDANDALGQEMGDDAKIWRAYAAESAEFDDNVVAEWNRTTDIILLFAALFSAVVTAFTIESYKMLSPDPQELTNTLLRNISQSLQMGVTAPATADISSGFDEFAPSLSAIWINALWFTALACSLGVGSLAMLVKQWLSAYLTGLPTAPRLRAQIRQRRYDNLCAWRTHDIINCMPMALSLCLIVFLSGLCILLLDLNRKLGLLLLVLISITVSFHAASIILPAICSCPWRTAISPIAFRMFLTLRNLFYVLIQLIIGFPGLRTSLRWLRTGLRWLYSALIRALSPLHIPSFGSYRLPSFKSYRFSLPSFRIFGVSWPRLYSELHNELKIVQVMRGTLEARALLWLIHSSSHKPVIDSAIQSLSGLPADLRTAELLLRAGALNMIRGRLNHDLGTSATTELYIRALLRLRLIARYLDHSPKTETTTLGLLNGVNIAPHDEAYITYICAKGAFNDIIDNLEAHHDGSAPLSRFQVFLLAHTLSQDAAWRKGPKDDHWTMGQTGGWAQLSTRAIPLLVDMLTVDSEGNTQPDLANSAIAFSIAIFTQGRALIDPRIYLDESKCQEDFYFLVVTGLSAILRFPASYGCKDSMLEVVRQKYTEASRKYVASRNLPRVADRSALMNMLRSSLKSVPKESDSPESLLLLLAQMGDRVLVGLDCALLIHALDASDPSPMFNFQLLVLLERLVWDCRRASQIASNGLTFGLQAIMRGPDSPVRSQAFRLLGRTAHMVAGLGNAMQVMISEGLLDLAQDFFTRPGSVNQEDYDLWLATLTGLSGKWGYFHNVRESGAAEALLDWAAKNWRGREMMAPHEEALKRLAKATGHQFEMKPSPDWFYKLITLPNQAQMKAREY